MVEQDIWAKLDRLTPTPSKVTAPSGSVGGGPSVNSRYRSVPISWLLDAGGMLLWSYGLIKVFVFDIDRWILGHLGTAAVQLLDYRLIFYLLALAAVAWFGRRHWWRVLYVLLFPLVVALWKVPRLLYRHRSWGLFLAIAQSIASVSNDLRYRLAVGSAGFAGTLLIVLTDVTPLLAVSAVFFAWFVVWSFFRFFRHSLRTPSFTHMQQTWIKRVLDSDRLASSWGLADEYKNPHVERYDANQTQQIAVRISIGIVINKVLYLWAYQLEEYRRSHSPALMFSAISFVSLFIGTLVGLALVNLAIFKIDPSQFSVTSTSGLLQFLLYGTAVLMGSTGGGITPAKDLSQAVQLGGTLVGVVVLVSLVVNFALTLRRERDEAATMGLVQDIKERAHRQEARFVEEYAVGVDEARRRLEEVGVGFAAIVTYITRSIPDEYFEPRTPTTRHSETGDTCTRPE